jgi:hypothetical protein
MSSNTVNNNPSAADERTAAPTPTVDSPFSDTQFDEEVEYATRRGRATAFVNVEPRGGRSNVKSPDPIPTTTITTDADSIVSSRRVADRRSSGTYIVLDPMNENFHQKFQQYKTDKSQVWDATAYFASGNATPGSYDLERKLQMDEKERAEFEKRIIVGTSFKLQYVDPIKLSTTYEMAGSISNFDRVIAQISSHLKRYDLDYLFMIDLVEPSTSGNGLVLAFPHTTVHMLTNHAYQSIAEPAIMNYVRWLHCFKKYPSDEERRLALNELELTYHFVLNCCDKELSAAVQDHIMLQPDYYTPTSIVMECWPCS